MQATSKFTRKVLSQIITVYQWTLDIDIEEAWIQLYIRPNKDVDDMLDVINAELIEVCWEYLSDKKLWLDKYQLATICAQLMTLAMEKCQDPFRITVKTTRALLQDYLEKNKKKRETLERVKKENKELDKRIEQAQAYKPEPAPIEEPQVQSTPVATPKQATPKKNKYNWDAYSISTKFTF